MSPIADNDHQWISFRLADALLDAMRRIEEARILPGANVTDQVENWTKNYRCPDVVVFLPGSPAVDRETHWLGVPDFAIEVVSPGDRSRKKFPF
jgi:Uma2 family endonuclease